MSQDNQSSDPNHVIKLMVWIGFWILVLIFVAMFFQKFLDSERNPNTSPETRYSEGVREVVLQRNRYGHYNLTGYINGEEVEFLVDTGATNISIPEHIAGKIGLQRLHEMMFETANGLAKGFATRLNKVRVGSIELSDLDASINPNVDDDTVLLGMSFLKKIEFTQKGDTLILRQYDY
jgi:aspartyl protease family protein